eukprot:gnl/TRDRNA2_/TRDRNA2_174247_c0_seq1.p2 gnl/TRDRNA2_/TRDRNA2_174247_c0~~gnl/TRDRNA2_/TRDRNA2_174247_c0_seq1.p2  ORF type:complete len:201 (+),score=39.10 gnl/TRDRNA2_/TRDRNA2_174247_c0_seq1:217-819(+)
MQAEMGVDLFRLPASSASSFLRLLTTPAANWTSMQLFPHIDYAASFAATVGVGSFNGTGVGFYSARGLQKRTVLKNLSDIAVYKLQSIPKFATDINARTALSGRDGDFSAASKHFELLLRRDLRMNRALFYPAWLLHRAVVPSEAGKRLTADPAGGRLTVNLFFTQDDHPIRKGEAPAAEPPDQELRKYLHTGRRWTSKR